MATSAQDIVRILQAAGGFIPDVDSNEYYVVLEESNELSERHWFGSQLASETLIALDIRTNSPAVYAVHDDIVSFKDASGRMAEVALTSFAALRLLRWREQCAQALHAPGR